MKARVTFHDRKKDPLLGARIAGYSIEEYLGKGRSATVYKATQLSLNRPVALKVLSPVLVRDQGLVEKFLNEARAIARLNHPNVVQVYDAIQEGNLIFFAMEYVPGGTLRDLLAKEKILSPSSTTLVACDTAEALSWAEERGIVHRDIKPANLLITGDGTAKVADLGIAIHGPEVHLGKNKRLAGSPLYMAPEQAVGKPVDHRADMYALGCTLFLALTGEHPFTGKTCREVIRAKLTMDPPLALEMNPQIPSSLAKAIKTMMARDPGDRFASCAEMRAALKAVRHEIGEPSSPGEARQARPLPTAIHPKKESPRDDLDKADKRSRVLMKILAACSGPVIFFLLFTVWTLVHPPDPENSRVLEHGTGPGASTVPRVETATPVDRTPLLPGEDIDLQDRTAEATELDTIINDHREGLISTSAAIAHLELLKKMVPDPEHRSAVERHLEDFRQELALETQREVQGMIDTEIGQLLEEKQFRQATTRLAKLSEEYPDCKSSFSQVSQRIEEAAREAWLKVSAEAQGLLLKERFDDARALLQNMASRLPKTFDKEYRFKLAAVEKEEKAYTECLKELDRVEQEVRSSLSALNFPEADSFESRLPLYPEGSPARNLVLKFTSRITERVQSCRETWNKITQGISLAIRENRSLKFVPGDCPERSTQHYRIVAFDKGSRTVQIAEPEGEKLSVFSIATSSLLQFLGGPGRATDAPVPQREGLGLLLLHQGRPFRARELLLDERLGEGKKLLYAEMVDRAEDRHISESVDALSRRRRELTGARTPRKRDWETLAKEVLCIAHTLRNSPKYKDVESDLEHTFTLARVEILRSLVPRNLFHGNVKSYNSGRLRLVYEFSSEEELQDFVPVLESGCGMELRDDGVRLMGEYRFCQGNPFRQSLCLSGRVREGGYSLVAPNINIALWTRENDRITPLGPGSHPPEDAGDFMDGYFVFGIGFNSSSVTSSFADPASLSIPGFREAVKMPVTVLLGGAHGRAVHEFPQSECIWGLPVRGKIRGDQAFEIRMDSGRVSWRINKRQQPIRRSREFDRLTSTAESFVGSFTIFTSGEVVLYESIEIDGQLNAEWVESRLERMAAREFRSLATALQMQYPSENGS